MYPSDGFVGSAVKKKLLVGRTLWEQENVITDVDVVLFL